MAKKKTDTYNNLAKSYYIALLGANVDDDGNKTEHTIKYVTDVSYYPKEARWNAGEPAYRFDSWKEAQDVCFGLLVNGYGAVIVQSLMGEGEDVMVHALHNVKEVA